MLEHSYGLTSLLGGWLGFLYGCPMMNGETANCHYGISLGPFFIGIVYATDADNFELE